MRSRPDPDAHLGPLTRTANREERVGNSRLLAVFWTLLTVLYLALAIASRDNVLYWLTALGWSTVAAIWWRQHLLARRAIMDARESDPKP